MKKIFTFCILILAFTAFTAHAQEKVVADFDQVNPNAFWGWDNQPATVANPYKSGINTSDMVLQWRKSAGSWKAFVISFDAVNVTANPVVSFQFYSPVKGTISVRLETGNQAETIYINVDITQTNTWVNYTTDLTPLLKTAKVFNQLSFFVNPDKNDDTSNYYWDDLKFSQKKIN